MILVLARSTLAVAPLPPDLYIWMTPYKGGGVSSDLIRTADLMSDSNETLFPLSEDEIHRTFRSSHPIVKTLEADDHGDSFLTYIRGLLIPGERLDRRDFPSGQHRLTCRLPSICLRRRPTIQSGRNRKSSGNEQPPNPRGDAANESGVT